jgi:membrane associated rhomboid family serine protease
VRSKLHPSGHRLKRIQRTAVSLRPLGVLTHAARDAVHPRILPAGEIVMEKRAGRDDEDVEDHHCHAGVMDALRADGTSHSSDYGTIARMIPLRDVIPSRTFPFINIALIVLNSLAFLAELSLSDAEFKPFLRAFALVPGQFLWPTVLTSMFIHAGWLHFLGNMLYLWIFGDNVEDRLGHFRYLVFYFLCGVVAAVAHTWMNPASMLPTLGASGAIAGVMGAYFVLYPRSQILTLIPFFIFYMRVVEVPAIVFLGLWLVLQFLSAAASAGTEAGGVAVWAHVAGFFAGAAWVVVFRSRRTTWD